MFLNGGAQDEAEPKTVQSLASSLEAGRMKSFIFQALEATCSEVAHAQKTTVGPSFPLLLLEYTVHSGHVCLSTGSLEHDSAGMISLK